MKIEKLKDFFPLVETTDKAVEIFYFFDPFCEECLRVEPIINKLMIEYRDYIILRKILSPSLKVLTKCQAQSTSDMDNVALAYKAAELQGQLKARNLLRFVQNRLTPNRSICTSDVIRESAELARLDVDAFFEDMKNDTVRALLRRDLAVYREMDISDNPSFVFFGGDVHEAGIKIEGVHPYYIFTHIVNGLIDFTIQKRQLPTIFEYIEKFEVVSFAELQEVYGWRPGLLLKELNKMRLQRLISSFETDYGVYYQLYVAPSDLRQQM